MPAPQAPAFDRRYRVSRRTPTGRASVATSSESSSTSGRTWSKYADKYTLPYLAAMLRKGWHPRVPRPVLVGLSCERFDDNMRAYVSGATAPRAFTRWYIRHIYGPPFDAHIAVSHYMADELRSALHDCPEGFVRVCGMGVDVSVFGPGRRSAGLRARLLRQAGGDERSVLLLYAGRLSPEKNVLLLVETLGELARDAAVDYRLVVAGEGPCAGQLRAQAARLPGGRLHVAGPVDRETLAAWYASADVFVHPNPHEPFGIGPLEAMASGVPVVAPASGGVIEYRHCRERLAGRRDAGGVRSENTRSSPQGFAPDCRGVPDRATLRLARDDAPVLRALRRDCRLGGRAGRRADITRPLAVAGASQPLASVPSRR